MPSTLSVCLFASQFAYWRDVTAFLRNALKTPKNLLRHGSLCVIANPNKQKKKPPNQAKTTYKCKSEGIKFRK